MWWREWWKYFQDCLLPIFCLQCNEEGKWWCEKCLTKASVQLKIDPIAVNNLDCLATFFIYNEKSIPGQLIQQFKYQFLSDIKTVWQKIAENNSEQLKILLSDTQIFIPVPLHKKRELERGFNQSQIIAEIIFQCAKNKDAVLSNDLKRIRATRQQAKLSAVERKENIYEAFVWQGENLQNKNVVIFDDVYTTGATMQECAKVLKNNGANKIIGFALARG